MSLFEESMLLDMKNLPPYKKSESLQSWNKKIVLSKVNQELEKQQLF